MEAAAVLAAFLIGWAYLRLFLAGVDHHVMGIAAFPFGVALWVLSVVVSLALGIPYMPWVVLTTVVAPLAWAQYRFARRLTPNELAAMAAWGGVMLVAGELARRFDLTVITSDNMFILSQGRQLVEYGGFTDGLKGTFASFSSFLSFVEMAAVSMGIDFFRSVVPLSSLATLLLIVWGGRRALAGYADRPAWMVWGLSGLAALALATTYPFLWGSFYVKTAPIYAFMLLVSGIGVLFTVRENQPRWLGLTALALVSTMTMRIEAGLTTLPALVAVLAVKEIPLNRRLGIIASVGIAFGAWYAFLINVTFAHGLFSVYQLFGIGLLPGLLGVAAAALAIPRIRSRVGWLTGRLEFLPTLMFTSLAVFIAAYAVYHPESALNAAAMFGCFLGDPAKGVTVFWGGAAIGFMLIPFFSRRIPGDSALFVSLLGFLLVLAAIGVQTPWKHCGTHDSTNRILVTVMPLAAFFILLKLGIGTARTPSAGGSER